MNRELLDGRRRSRLVISLTALVAAALAFTSCAPDASELPRSGMPRVKSPTPAPAAWSCRVFERPVPWAPVQFQSSLTPGVSLRRTFDSAVAQEFSFELRASDFVHLEVDQDGVDVGLMIVSPAGQTLLLDRVLGRHGRESIPLVVPRDGGYTLRVRPLGRRDEGGYVVRLGAARRAGPRERRWAQASDDMAEAERLSEAATPAERKRSLDTFRAAIDACHALGLRAEEAYALRRLAVALADHGKRPEARTLLERASEIARAANDPREEGRVLLELGEVQRRLSQVDAALLSFDRAVALGRSSRAYRLIEAAALQRRGLHLANLGRPDRAVEDTETAVDIWREEQRPDLVGDALSMLCHAYNLLGRPPQAQATAHCALDLAQLSGDQRAAAEAYLQLGWRRHLDGQPAEALHYYARGLDLASRFGWDEIVGAFLDRRASALQAQGRWDSARAAYEDALARWRAIEDTVYQAHTLANLASLEARLGRWPQAEAHYEQAIHDFKKASEEDNRAQVIVGRARLLRDGRPPSETLTDIEKALTVFEHLRQDVRSAARASYLAARHQVYELKVDVLLHQAAPSAERAFEAAESGRARALADDLDPSGAVAAAVFPLTATQALLDDDTLLLAYSLGAPRSYLWLVSHRNLEVHALPERDRVGGLLDAWYRALQVRQPSEGQRAQRDELGRELSRILLSPVAARLRSKRLLIVRDERLQHVPFAALPIVGEGGSLLIDRHEVVNAPSALVLHQLRRRAHTRARAPRPVAVFADPVFAADDERLPPAVKPADLPRALKLALDEVGLARPARLPMTGTEAERILRIAGARARGARGLDANLGAFEAPHSRELSEYRRLHFATHGLLNRRNPRLSGLLLSLYGPDGQARNGFLRAEQVERLPLRADLVTLSACHTALGEPLRGEGLIGLTHAFLKAGASRVIVSLWEVEEQATTDLMTRFYTAHMAHGRPVAAALREAQLALRVASPGVPPADWAAFVVEGDW
jgi:CHAT domain-containing protein